jgi:hypothetical protein
MVRITACHETKAQELRVSISFLKSITNRSSHHLFCIHFVARQHMNTVLSLGTVKIPSERADGCSLHPSTAHIQLPYAHLPGTEKIQKWFHKPLKRLFSQKRSAVERTNEVRRRTQQKHLRYF